MPRHFFRLPKMLPVHFSIRVLPASILALCLAGPTIASPVLESPVLPQAVEAEAESAIVLETTPAPVAVTETGSQTGTSTSDDDLEARLAAANSKAEANARYAATLKQQLEDTRKTVAHQTGVLKQFADTSKAYAAGERRLNQMQLTLDKEREFAGRLQNRIDELESQLAQSTQASLTLETEKAELNTRLAEQQTATDALTAKQESRQQELQSRLTHLAAQLDELEKKRIIQVLRLPSERLRIRVASDRIFSPDQVRISPQGLKHLSQVAGIINASHSRRVQVRVHADRHTQRPPAFRSYSELTREQARAVIAHLRNHEGVNRRFSSQGLGGSDPLASHQSNEGRAMNRRIEFLLDPGS